MNDKIAINITLDNDVSNTIDEETENKTNEKMYNLLKCIDSNIFYNSKNIMMLKCKMNRKALELAVRVKVKNNKIKRYKYFIKETKCSYEKNVLINMLIEEARRKGFKNLSKDKLIIKDEKVLNVSENIKRKKYNATRIDFKNSLDLIEAVKLIKKFHSIKLDKSLLNKIESKNLLCEFKKINYYGRWQEIYSRKKFEIICFKNIIDSKENELKEDFDKKYNEEINFILKECERSKDILEKSKYRIKANFNNESFGICHHDLEFHNIMKVDDGKKERYYLIDFEYVIVDIWQHDFASMIKRVIRNNRLIDEKILSKKDILEIEKIKKLVKVMLDAYKLKESKDMKDDIEIMKSFILFPEEFWQIGYQKYVEQQNWETERFNRRLEKAIIIQKNKEYLIKALDDYC